MAMSMLFAGPKYYDDRLMVYIDDSVTDFTVLDDKIFVSTKILYTVSITIKDMEERREN